MCLAIQSPISTKKPDVTFYEIDSSVVETEIKDLGILLPLGILDIPDYYYTTLWGIQESVKWVRKVYKFPEYQTSKMDCDDFAFLMKGLMSSEFGLNTCGLALGFAPSGYHAFNLARAEQKWVFIEPQTGEIFDIGDKGYTCDRAIL